MNFVILDHKNQGFLDPGSYRRLDFYAVEMEDGSWLIRKNLFGVTGLVTRAELRDLILDAVDYEKDTKHERI